MTIEDYKLEIKLLQKKDTENAFEHGYTTKKAWLTYINAQTNDETAKNIINIAKRYNVSPYLVALNFDSTMIYRIKKYLLNEKKELKK